MELLRRGRSNAESDCAAVAAAFVPVDERVRVDKEMARGMTGLKQLAERDDHTLRDVFYRHYQQQQQQVGGATAVAVFFFF
jgi:hypothetical protein